MLDFTKPNTLYYLPGHTPSKMSLESLAQLIKSSQSFNSSETAAYMFFYRDRNPLRVLYWDTQ